MGSHQKPSVGFVGLGAMGFGMAANLVKQGYSVTGYDVFAKSMERFKSEAGGNTAGSPAESATDMPFYVCMVASAPQAQSVLFDAPDCVVKALPRNATLLLCSTVPSAYAQSVAEQLKSIGRGDILFVDCPVSGGATRAANGTLTIMAGGSEDALAKARFLLEEMSDPNSLYIVEGGVGQGSNMKMVHQVLAAIHILLASETMGLAARWGLDAKTVRDKVVESEAWTWMFENRVPRMLEEDYFPGVSALTIILKDVSIITSTARLNNFPTPLSSTAEQMYLLGLSQGFGSQDDAGMVRLYFPEAVSSVQSKSEADDEKMHLLVQLLLAVQHCATAEAISLASHLGLDLKQFHRLTTNAAGGSVVFREGGGAWIDSEESKSDQALWLRRQVDDAVLRDVATALQQARDASCPLPLGTQAFNLLLQARIVT
ncbi:hypothetical protein K490DRAFT_37440 [Saccharata proteae CBS 121410]|uniref:Oxidoreductase-like protein n=1 Tax=Saccharata proteae CBS 121410 TaxID=1314787 RepID=A0A6A5YCT1_9PEZI|nr:hypothetical protein K490DRAFT_37440 [Saccharata proteae CBS 121410]